MSDEDEIKARLDRLEREVALWREGLATAQLVAAQTAVLNTLCETQAEQGQAQAEHGQLLGLLMAGLRHHEELLNEILRRLPGPQ